MMTLDMLERKDPLTLVGPEGPARDRDGAAGALGRVALVRRALRGAAPAVQARGRLRRARVHRRGAAAGGTGCFCAGYRFVEKNAAGAGWTGRRRGALGRQRGVAVRGRSKRGRTVCLPGGHVVRARRGRRAAAAGRARGVRLRHRAVRGREGRWPTAPTCSSTRRTFCEDQKERAEAVGHSTGKQAAEVAPRRRGRSGLLLTHFSARFPRPAAPSSTKRAPSSRTPRPRANWRPTASSPTPSPPTRLPTTPPSSF